MNRHQKPWSLRHPVNEDHPHCCEDDIWDLQRDPVFGYRQEVVAHKQEDNCLASELQGACDVLMRFGLQLYIVGIADIIAHGYRDAHDEQGCVIYEGVC